MSAATLDGPPQFTPGFCGKLSSHGDFVTRRLPRSFLAPWEEWLNDCLQSSRERLGSEWLDIYLTSPIWRFVTRKGALDDVAWTGVLMPSVDKVGRHYPLTLAVDLPHEGPTLSSLGENSAWYDRAEDLALSSLDDDFDFDSFDDAVRTLGEPGGRIASTRCLTGDKQGQTQWYFAVRSEADLRGAFGDVLEQLSADVLRRCTVWWTSGSERVPPSIVVCPGLPAASGFAAFLDGRWYQWGWNRELSGASPDNLPSNP